MNPSGQVAFITGGASGVGLGVAHAFAGAGMKLCIADLREDRLAEAKAALEAKGAEVEAIRLDVVDRDAMRDAARRVVDRFGKVNIAVANAGVGFVGRVRDASYDDWDWSTGVNLGGVVNVIQEFLPIIRAQGEGGHMVATASMGGLTPLAHGGVYSVQKMAVVAIMESLYLELAGEGIGASVICPGMTRTNIGETLKLRPDHFSEHGVKVTMPSGPPPAGFKSPMESAMDPMEVGQRVLAGVLAGDLYILTHNEFAEEITQQFEPILACMPPAPPPPPEALRGAAEGMFPIYKRVLNARGR